MGIFSGLRKPHQNPNTSLVLPTLSWYHQRFLTSDRQADRFASYVARQQWRALQDDQDLCQQARTYCLLCGKWFGRPADLQPHWRQAHGIKWSLVGCRAVQLPRLLQVGSPCTYCKKAYRTEHLCPVLFQVGLLQVYGIGVAPSELRNSWAPDAFRCLLCNLDFDTEAALRQHLNMTHKLPTWDWLEARDCFESSDTCSHCLSLHTNKEALRRHITMGSCPAFDADRDAWTQSPDASAVEALLTGDLADILTAQRREDWTCRCSCCGKQYQRSTDLMAHLQFSHSQYYDLAVHHAKLIHLYMHPIRCVCTPMFKKPQPTHLCPIVVQMCYQFLKSDLDVLAPWKYDEQDVRRLLRHCVSEAAANQITQHLLSRDFLPSSGLSR